MNGAIGIIALDLDGTLLTSDKRLSGRNRAALARAAAAGAHIVPTTGRFFDMMPAEVRDLEFVRYAITVNGAEVFDRATGEAVVREEIPLADALGLMELLDRHDVVYDCYRGGWGWMTGALRDKAAGYATDEHYLSMIREFRRPVPELKAHLRATAAEGDVQKVMLFARNDDRAAAVGELRGVAGEIAAQFPGVKVTSSTWNNLEINAAAADKGGALRRLAGLLGMTLAECMAFGDGMNDLSMVKAAGLGVAMANACEEVKRAAKWIAPSNDDDGVAKGVEKWMFSE
ncbi:MAG: HAD family phosphatase [Kiritimatiellae bacterium]|nr:HAD family phosphatase [Kiritimatiellia bacterium]